MRRADKGERGRVLASPVASAPGVCGFAHFFSPHNVEELITMEDVGIELFYLHGARLPMLPATELRADLSAARGRIASICPLPGGIMVAGVNRRTAVLEIVHAPAAR